LFQFFKAFGVGLGFLSRRESKPISHYRSASSAITENTRRKEQDDYSQ